MFRLQLRRAFAQLHQQHLIIIGRISLQHFQQLFLILQFGFNGLYLVDKLIVQKLIQKYLCDDFELIAIAAKTIGGTNAFEAVDEGFGGFFELEGEGHWVILCLNE